MNNSKDCPGCNKIISIGAYHTCDAYKVDSANTFSNIGAIQRTADALRGNTFASNPLYTDYNMFGVNTKKIIEKLKEELVSSQRSADFAREQKETAENKNIILEKKNAKSEKKIKKITRERDGLKIDLKISEDVKRNLLNRLDNP